MTGPTDPKDSVDLKEPTGPEDPVIVEDAVDPDGPTGPDYPVDPDDPTGPGEPVDVDDPTGPGEPVDVDDPTGPGEPVDGEEPDDGVEPPAIDPRIRQRRVDIRRSEGQRRLRWVVGVGGAAVLVVVVVALLHTGWFSAQAITVTGTHPHTSDAAIVDASGLGRHPALIDVNPAATARRVETLPFVASARVSRHWPDGVGIEVTERVPVVQMAGPGSGWSLLDGNGRTLQVEASRQPGLVVFVVHTAGSGIPPAPVGGSLPPAVAPGLTVCRTLPPAFVAQVESVTVAADGSISMDLYSGITVLVGTTTDLVAKYKDIAAILAHGTLHATSTIDVTVPGSPTVSG
jgi:cell division protein FtsQ